MQKSSKIRITTICTTKTTSDLGKVTFLQNFHDFFSLFVSLQTNSVTIVPSGSSTAADFWETIYSTDCVRRLLDVNQAC